MRLAVEEAAAGAGGADGLQHQRDDQPCLIYTHAISWRRHHRVDSCCCTLNSMSALSLAASGNTADVSLPLTPDDPPTPTSGAT